jgi:RimJ/RimL family protein N-acetyltransferase
VCAAQVALDGTLVGVIRRDHGGRMRRGNGYATLACASLLSWAWQHGRSSAYLQVTADNPPAIAAYRKFGFATAYTYHYRGREGECE